MGSSDRKSVWTMIVEATCNHITSAGATQSNVDASWAQRPAKVKRKDQARADDSLRDTGAQGKGLPVFCYDPITRWQNKRKQAMRNRQFPQHNTEETTCCASMIPTKQRKEKTSETCHKESAVAAEEKL